MNTLPNDQWLGVDLANDNEKPESINHSTERTFIMFPPTHGSLRRKPVMAALTFIFAAGLVAGGGLAAGGGSDLASLLNSAAKEFTGMVVDNQGQLVLQYDTNGEKMEANLRLGTDALSAAAAKLVGQEAVVVGVLRTTFIETMPPKLDRTIYVENIRPSAGAVGGAAPLTVDEAGALFARIIRSHGGETEIMALTILERSGLLKEALTEVLNAMP